MIEVTENNSNYHFNIELDHEAYIALHDETVDDGKLTEDLIQEILEDWIHDHKW